MSIPVIAADCKSIRTAYLKEKHRCIGLFRKAYAPEKQPPSGDIQTDVGVNMCFATLESDYPEFADGGECVGVEEENIDKKFEGYAKRCLHQSDFSECNKALENVKSVDNIRNGIGATLLMVAAQEGDMDAMNFLLQKGASAKRVDHNAKTLLHYAVTPKTEKFDGFKDTNKIILNIVKKVLDLGVHPQELTINGWSSLFWAVHQNLSSDIVERLLNNGANTNLRYPIGKHRASPIYEAIVNNEFENVQLLLKAGSDPNTKTHLVTKEDTSWSEVPLVLSAILDDNIKIVKALIDAGANVNAVVEDQYRNYPLLEMAEYFIAKKLKCDCNDEICKKRCDAAVANDEIIVLLKKAGAVKSKSILWRKFY